METLRSTWLLCIVILAAAEVEGGRSRNEFSQSQGERRRRRREGGRRGRRLL